MNFLGWAVLWYDKKEKSFLELVVLARFLGQCNGCDMILALDMWEHAYVYDYPTSEKKNMYRFYTNLDSIEENYIKAKS